MYCFETRPRARIHVQTNTGQIHKQRMRKNLSEPRGAASDNGICVALLTNKLCMQTQFGHSPLFPNACLPPSFPLQTLPNNLSHNGRSTRRQRLQLLRSRLAGTSSWLRFHIRQPLMLVCAVPSKVTCPSSTYAEPVTSMPYSFRCGPSRCNLRPSHG